MSAHTGSTSITTTEVLYKPAKTDSIVTSARNYLVGSAYQIFQNGQGISITCALKYHSCAVIIDRVKNLRVVLKTYFSVLFSAVLCRICPLPRPRQRRSPGSPGRCPTGPPPCPHRSAQELQPSCCLCMARPKMFKLHEAARQATIYGYCFLSVYTAFSFHF